MCATLRSVGAMGLAAIAMAGLAPAAGAAGDGTIALELNRLEQRDDTCRLTLLFTNRLDSAVDTLEIETVLFDREKRVERFVVFKSRPLKPGKIRAQQFDLTGLRCDGVGSVLVNDVTACKAGDLDAAGCLARIAPSTRGDVPLVISADDSASADSGNPETE
ncbi:hypothetical protein HW532_03385 [Kaustia mangrovi]|uniref:Tat pathway signal sequence domain protein n=1 Tax=Kaustia mangrovi TaxID=2593653 RepID=A0A7S8C1V8_9HYPH|nr:hypothetical protein [Kaustia mangrovi]QPC41841.1 hypothetical protein HW532_03385 [Kaustia mangrovi]